MPKKRVGELLLERRAITQKQLDAGLLQQKRTHQRLGQTLIEQGVISEAQLADALAGSLDLGTIDLSASSVDWKAVHLLRPRFCESHQLFAFGFEAKGTPNQMLLVAMSDPLDQAAVDEIEFTTGVKVSRRVGVFSQIREWIQRYYYKGASAFESRPTPAPGELSTMLAPPAVEDEPLVVIGREIAPTTDVQSLLTDQKPLKRPTISDELRVLVGAEDEGDPVQRLERRFWAMMRLMARKGVITHEEFLKELDES